MERRTSFSEEEEENDNKFSFDMMHHKLPKEENSEQKQVLNQLLQHESNKKKIPLLVTDQKFMDHQNRNRGKNAYLKSLLLETEEKVQI